MLIAEGNYAYRLNGEDAGVTESWSIRQNNDGKIVTNSIRDASQYKSKIEVNAVSQAGVITAFDVIWHNGMDNMVEQAEANYQILDNTVKLRRVINSNDETYKFDYATLPIVSPLMRVFTGDVIIKLSKFDTPTDVLIPNITNPADKNQLLLPKIEQRHAKLLHRENLEIAGKIISTECYSYIGEQYGDDARFWVDAHGLLVRYTWGQWDVFLDHYERLT